MIIINCGIYNTTFTLDGDRMQKKGRDQHQGRIRNL